MRSPRRGDTPGPYLTPPLGIDKQKRINLNDWGVPQVKRCLKDAKEMIEKGSII
jgi:hypothetical protein